MRHRSLRLVATTSAGLLAATALVAASAAPATVAAHGYLARITRASYGVPHIVAADFGSLGFGEGYAQAEDNLCLIAENVITVSAQRARYFGPGDASASNVASDLFYQQARDEHVVQRLLAGRPDGVHAPSRDARDLVRGFVAGYNAYLRRTGVTGLTDPACSGRPWVRPLSEDDVWSTIWSRMIMAGQGSLLPEIASAAPPGVAPPAVTPPAVTSSAAAPPAVASSTAAAPGPGAPPAATRGPDPAAVRAVLHRSDLGSNAYGLGRDATVDGAGMLLANPHFPWDGPDRFYRMQLRIPGRYDVEGAALVGDPMIEIGHNATLAWSHTVSTANRFVIRRLTLAPGDPTAYLVDGRPERMTRHTVTVRVAATAGGTTPVTRTLYSTRYGPVLVLPGQLPWTSTVAYAVTDVNATNNRAVDGWLAMGQAGSVRQLRTVLDRRQFLPWVNVIASDARGEALYGDDSVIPRVSDALASACIPAAYQPLFAQDGVPVLDGSRTACDLGRDPGAVAPGIFAASRLPVLIRSDYVTNSNDSYWLANPAQPLEGFPRIIGDERTPRSLRTRLGLLQVQQRIAGTDGLPGARFTTADLWQVMFGDRVYGGELVRDDLVRLCTAHPSATASDGTSVDLTAACAALRGWDLHANLDSRGVAVFLQFALARGIRFADPFVVSDPVNTPRHLATGDPAVLTALADAVEQLAGIPADAPLGSIQTEPRGRQRIPIHGTSGVTGAFNVINAPMVPGQGYPTIVHGSSFVMAVELGRGGPSGRQLLTYSQSANPNSPYFADQTELYSRKGWDTIKYTDAQLAADPHAFTVTVRSDRS